MTPRLAALLREARNLESIDTASRPLAERLSALAVELNDLGAEFGALSRAQRLDPLLLTNRLLAQLATKHNVEVRAFGSEDVTLWRASAAEGSEQPVVECSQKSPAALRACLQPNRRVEIILRGVK